MVGIPRDPSGNDAIILGRGRAHRTSTRSPRQEEPCDRTRLDGPAGAGGGHSSTSRPFDRIGTTATPATPTVPVWYLRLDRLAGCVEYISTIRDVSSHRHQRAGRRRAPDGYGLGTRTHGPDRLRRPSHPPEFRAERMHMNAESTHVRYHL